MAEIAQLLVVVEKLSFFESAILKKKLEKNNFFFASFPRKLVNINRIARMGQNFDDYPVFQQIPGMPILLQQSLVATNGVKNMTVIKILHK